MSEAPRRWPGRFRDRGEAGHAARYARRSLDIDGRYVRGRAFNLSLLATAYAAQGEPVQASRRSATSRRRYASGCPSQQGMLRPDGRAD